MKKLFLIIVLVAVSGSILFTSCDKEDDDPKTNRTTITGTSTKVIITENVTENTTWVEGKEYVLTTRIAVTNGAILTIEPGVIVKGEAGSGDNATVLIIAQGAKIMAEGTADKPIIFTTIADKITPGFTNIASPNLEPTLNGLWGGLIVLGKAPVSVENGETAQIEGIPSSDANGLYGGNVTDDNSGVIKYVSIRHGGSNIGSDNEINGLTLGGVGSGTTIENVEIVGNQDDGIEFFGGTVNIKNVVVWNNGDDAIDTDQAWAGTLDNFVIVNPGDKAFELDGPEGSYAGAGHTIKNGTVYMMACKGGYDDDDNTDAVIMNVFFTAISHKTGTSNDYHVNGNFMASNIEFDVTPVDLDGDTAKEAPKASDYFSEIVEMSPDAMTEVTAPTVGANKSALSWTWASLKF